MSDMVLRASQWCYQGVWAGVTRWLRVPEHPPTLPTSAASDIRSFRPSQAYLDYQKFFFWIGLAAIDIVLTALWIILTIAFPLAGILITPLALAVIVLPDIVAYIAIHLRYDTTWYVLSDRSLRIRRGIWRICETTITFENIQNIHLSQGPLQRHFGYANLVVETAGGGAVHGPHGQQGTNTHIGILEGLDNATQVRDLILERLKKCRSAGLGDERNFAHPQSLQTSNLQVIDLDLLREIRDLTSKL